MFGEEPREGETVIVQPEGTPPTNGEEQIFPDSPGSGEISEFTRAQFTNIGILRSKTEPFQLTLQHLLEDKNIEKPSIYRLMESFQCADGTEILAGSIITFKYFCKDSLVFSYKSENEQIGQMKRITVVDFIAQKMKVTEVTISPQILNE